MHSKVWKFLFQGREEPLGVKRLLQQKIEGGDGGGGGGGYCIATSYISLSFNLLRASKQNRCMCGHVRYA